MAMAVTVVVDTSKEMSWRLSRFPDMDECNKEEEDSLRASRVILLSSFKAGGSSKLNKKNKKQIINNHF